MAHVHDAAEAPVDARLRKMLALIAIVAAVGVVVGMFLLRPTGKNRPDLSLIGVTAEFYDGEVADILQECAGVPDDVDVECRTLRIRLLNGPDKGDEIDIEFPDTLGAPDFGRGDKLVLAHDGDAEPGFEYRFADRQRKPTLFWLAALFGLAVVILGRLRGLAALVGLAASLVVLLGFALPAIIDGRSPVWVAVIAAGAISFLALYLAHGFTTMTTVALLGTLGALILTAVLAVVFMELAQFSGLASEESSFLAATAGSIDLRGLLLAGVVIGALGALDDMTVTQASAVWELRAANPAMSVTQLFQAALRIGRDHVASTVNTLVLAYAGASMPLLVLFVLSNQPLAAVANSEVVAVEIVRTLVGSIGLVASVPLTTWLAALAVGAGARSDPSRPAAPVSP